MASLLILHSCILKEFNFSENKLESDWDMQLLVPLFYGNLEFKDFVYDWKSPLVINSAEPTVKMEFSADSIISFPVQQIYEPATIIDSFNFLIEGDDYISEIVFNYTVTNESPFPMYLQMRFFEKSSSADQSPEIVAGPFPALTAEYTYSLQLTDSQSESFKTGNRIEFVSWFEKESEAIPDTLSAHYPINLSIVLSGIANAYYQ